LVTYSLENYNGMAGVFEKTFDKMTESSIVWNVYFAKKQGTVVIAKTTFSVLKTVALKEATKIQVVPVYDLIIQTDGKDGKAQLTTEMQVIAHRFIGKDNFVKVAARE